MENSTPLIICANQRSGTTVLQKTLCKNNDFKNFGEVCHHLRTNDKVSFFNFRQKLILDNIDYSIPSNDIQSSICELYFKFLRSKTKAKFFIVDFKYNSWHHLNTIWNSPSQEPFLMKYILSKGFPIIHIIRRNKFAQFVSIKYATKLNKFHFYNEYNSNKENVKIDIDYKECINFIERSINDSILFQRWLNDYNRVLTFYYEEMFNDIGEYNDIFVEKLSKTLKVSKTVIETKPGLRKSILNPRDIFYDYYEVYKMFEGSPYEHYVKDYFDI
jgi:LPS sulfotransferase NodH